MVFSVVAPWERTLLPACIRVQAGSGISQLLALHQEKLNPNHSLAHELLSVYLMQLRELFPPPDPGLSTTFASPPC